MTITPTPEAGETARNLTRLQQLHNLRAQIDQEIEREERFLRRVRRLSGAAKVIVTTRGDYSARVIAVSAAHFGIGPDDIVGTGRHRDTIQARMVAAWILRQDGRSYPEIGRALGKDHSTVIHACRRIEADETLMSHAVIVRGALLGSEDAA